MPASLAAARSGRIGRADLRAAGQERARQQARACDAHGVSCCTRLTQRDYRRERAGFFFAAAFLVTGFLTAARLTAGARFADLAALARVVAVFVALAGGRPGLRADFFAPGRAETDFLEAGLLPETLAARTSFAPPVFLAGAFAGADVAAAFFAGVTLVAGLDFVFAAAALRLATGDAFAGCAVGWRRLAG